MESDRARSSWTVKQLLIRARYEKFKVVVEQLSETGIELVKKMAFRNGKAIVAGSVVDRLKEAIPRRSLGDMSDIVVLDSVNQVLSRIDANPSLDTRVRQEVLVAAADVLQGGSREQEMRIWKTFVYKYAIDYLNNRVSNPHLFDRASAFALGKFKDYD